MLGSARAKALKLFRREIIFEPIPTYVITVPKRHRQTDRQTDRVGRTIYDRNTALCTKVHRAVKTDTKNSNSAIVCNMFSLFLLLVTILYFYCCLLSYGD